MAAQTTPHPRTTGSQFATFGMVVRTPSFLPLLIASVLIGFRESMSLPYVTLFAVERAHMAPIGLGAFLTVKAAGAIAISMLFGRWFDRRPSIWPLVLALAAGCVGYGLLTTTTDFALLGLIAALPLGAGAAAFPLIFALAKFQVLEAEPVDADRGIALLRASFSAAWGIGPALGALVVGNDNYGALFWVSAAFSGLALLPLAARGVRVPPVVSTSSPAPRTMSAALLLAAGSLTLFSMAIGMGAVALPITITAGLAGTKADVGLTSSLCALLEVPVMVAIAARPSVFSGYRGMVMGFIAIALYFGTAALASSVQGLVWAQALRAVGIGFVSCVGISYLQDLVPNRVGAASVLYANTSQIGQLLAGFAAGLWAQAYSYSSLFWVSAICSVAGLGCLAAGSASKPTGS